MSITRKILSVDTFTIVVAEKIINILLGLKFICFVPHSLFLFFFYQGFQTLTMNGASLIPLYHSTSSRIFRYLFETLYVRWLLRILIESFRVTRLLLDEIFTTFSNFLFLWWWRWNINFCLLDHLILDFITAIWHGKPVDLNSRRLSSKHNKQID